MGLDRYGELYPADGEVIDDELVVSDDVLVKVFALGPGAEVSPHEHASSSNVFHVLEGTLTVIQGDDTEEIRAPGVVFNERGVVHGGRNETDGIVVFTASLCPMPG